MTLAPMRRAIELARRAEGLTSPNPPVGAVLVKDGAVIGEGFTQPVGHEHAEIVALAAAGAGAKGAKIYVTLEPCSHWGRTPPCADALIAAGIVEAHVAALDPNPAVNGEGMRRLEEHGIRVMVGECADEAGELVEAHAKYIVEGCPFVTLLLDAPEDVTTVLQARTDAILTDVAAPRSELPRTTSPIRPPLVVLVGRSGGTPPVDDRTLVVTGRGEGPGGSTGDEQDVDFVSLLAELGRHGIVRAVANGTPALAAQLLERGLVDKIVAGPDRAVPGGFSAVRKDHVPSPYSVLYRAATV